jgi:hypothetical protein
MPLCQRKNARRAAGKLTRDPLCSQRDHTPESQLTDRTVPRPSELCGLVVLLGTALAPGFRIIGEHGVSALLTNKPLGPLQHGPEITIRDAIGAAGDLLSHKTHPINSLQVRHKLRHRNAIPRQALCACRVQIIPRGPRVGCSCGSEF